MSAVVDFLFPAPAERRTGAIVKWWEQRRLHYNLIVGATGTMSLGFTMLMSVLPPSPDALEGSPIPVVLGFALLANICYTIGPVAEAALQRLWGRSALPVGPALFRMGLTFSVGLTMLPSLMSVFHWGFRIVRALM